MLKPTDSAPRFDCTAVAECEVVHLKWHQVHCNQNLVLIFDSIEDQFGRPNNLSTLSNAASRFEILECKLAAICRDDEFEVLTWMQRLSAERGSRPIGLPVIVDTDNQIASMYDMLSVDGPVWGHVIVDSNAKVRSVVAHLFPLGLNVDELIRCVAAVVESDDD